MTRRSFIDKLFKFLALPLIPAGISSFLASCFSMPVVIEKSYSSDHYNGKTFFHPEHKIERKGFSDVMKWRMSRVSGPWPEKVEVNTTVPPERVTGNRLGVTFIGHATVLVQTQGVNLLFDPHWGDRASPVSFAGPKRVTPPGVNIQDLPPLDAILISHNHHEHMHFNSLKQISAQQIKIHQKSSVKLVVPLGNKSIIDMGVLDHRFEITEQDWGEKLDFPNNVTAVSQPTYHWSARGVFDSYKALWCAYVVTTDGGNIYFAGDTGFGFGENAGKQFEKTQKQFGSFRFSILPVGAYLPRDFMMAQHINPEESVKASEILQSKYILGVHLQTFKDLTDEGYEEPVRDLEVALEKSEMDFSRFRVLKAGEFWEVPSENS